MASWRNGLGFRVPDALARDRARPPRVLVVGSCLIGAVPEYMGRTWGQDCVDWIPLNNFAKLPGQSPRALAEYDCQLVQLATRSVLREEEYVGLQHSEAAAWEQLFESCVQRLKLALDEYLGYNRQTGLLTFVANFLVPQQNPMGRLLPRVDYRNFAHFFRRLNDELSAHVAGYRNAYVLDVDEIAASIGRRYIQDDAVWSIAHNAAMSDFDWESDRARIQPPDKMSTLYEAKVYSFVQEVVNELHAAVETVRGTDGVKMVVTDLDDTLWRGLVGENEKPTNEGWPKGYAEALWLLKNRGVLVAVISRNDEELVRKNWRSIFRPEDFVATKINWKDKVANMQALLQEVNLLPSNVVYVDDNPVERENMRMAFPDMRILGDSPYETRRILLWSPQTQVPLLTAESERRTQMVSAQVAREQLRRTATREEFLLSLKVKLEAARVMSPEDANFPRAFELLNKTNQFNTTGKRWTEIEAVQSLARGDRWYVFSCRDSFTDYGIVSTAMVSDAAIDQWVLSCRVFGFDLEAAILSILARLEPTRPITRLAFVATERNFVALQCLSDMGLRRVDSWYEATDEIAQKMPAHIEWLASEGATDQHAVGATPSP